jgi:hypothetical protein
MKVSATDAIAEAMKRGVYDPFSGEVDVGKAMGELKSIGVGDLSMKQLSRLRNGHKVRVGAGLGQLIVTPERYDTMSRTFGKGKKMAVQLSPQEISANRQVVGEGIFGPGFDKFLGKIGIKKQVYALGDKLKGPVKKAVKAFTDKAPAALGSAGAALATYVGQPQLAPLAIKAGAELGKKVSKYSDKHIQGYIDDPEAYQKDPSKFGDLKGVGLYASGRGAGEWHPMWNPSGRGMDRKAVTMANLAARESSGCGLYASSSRGGALSIVGGRQSMMGQGHPAMASQPMGELFHQRYQISPQMLKGAGLSL